MEETSWVLALCSSRETQNKLEGASRTKPVLKELQHEMAAAGQERTREQFSIKLKKVWQQYMDQKHELSRNY